MRIQSLPNAGLLIEADGVRLLCDPWFTDGAYQGAWAIWPQPLKDPVRELGKVNAIYISHIHPDHYDQTFLRQYLQYWGDTPIVCGLQSLTDALHADGFPSAQYVSAGWGIDNVGCRIIPNTTYRAPFDTALAVRCGSESLINYNDNPTDPLLPTADMVTDTTQLKALMDFCGGSPTVAYLPFAGASSYPQRFTFPSEAECRQAATLKQHRYLKQFLKTVDILQPKYVVPFAGEYWLQGPLAKYNHLRGQTDATEAVALCKQAILPAAGAWFDTTTGQATAVRTKPYDPSEAMRDINARGFTGYQFAKDYSYAHEWVDDDALETFSPKKPLLVMDDRYMLGLISRRYHWNDALISSHVGILDPIESLTNDMFEALEAWHL